MFIAKKLQITKHVRQMLLVWRKLVKLSNVVNLISLFTTYRAPVVVFLSDNLFHWFC